MFQDEVFINKYKEQLLFDFYGELLSKKLKKTLIYYYNDDYSATEIADLMHLTRQGAYDAIRRGRKQLQQYENKLKLVERFEKTQHLISKIENELLKLKEDKQVQNSPEAMAVLNNISEQVESFSHED
ncbi:DNA-binding protein [Pseudoramibacter sp.]|jgi:predicted DNA-binding protein YlxM (UPF0122 family)|uniref:DNA-binding protein n=1 Tax=Pseudoramibacter sp. TaxID=2034862 RepID=UPI0025E1A36C|nr:DNA-binding protein [Pseudoramibacter sp.]MCH4072792.1 DNA-binding protein [Pseudoramibacter sp.]MCH4106563.1 DNA-binding protein [Pseudoramibacter sp.]